MGKLRSGILGHLSGKVAGVVGSRWKDQSTLREYVIPANPNTTPQQAQRSKMRVAVGFLKDLVGQVFNQYVDKFQKTMSGFNYAISQNIAYCVVSPTYANIRLTWGNLWGAIITAATYSTPNVVITWEPSSLGNNGSATDKVYAVVYDISSNQWYFAAAEVARSTGTITVPCAAGLTESNLKAYAWAAKYSTTSPTLLEMVSNSDYDQVTD